MPDTETPKSDIPGVTFAPRLKPNGLPYWEDRGFMTLTPRQKKQLDKKGKTIVCVEKRYWEISCGENGRSRSSVYDHRGKPIPPSVMKRMGWVKKNGTVKRRRRRKS